MKKELLLISIASDSHRNIGCLSLYAAAREAGIVTELLFIPRRQEYDPEAFVAYLKISNFNVVGISLTTRDYAFAIDITKDIRKAVPKAHIIWGGIHPTSKPEECLTHADSVCIGEGEIALSQLILSLKKGEDVEGIPGIGLKDKNGSTVINQPRLIEDLDSLPFPRFDFQNFYVLDGDGLHNFGSKDYVKYARHKGDGYVLLTSRSCPHYCSYCINSFLNRLYNDRPVRLYRRRSVDHVLKEILRAMDTIPSIGFINFMDDHFLTDGEWIKEFCGKYKKKVGLPFIIRATPATIKNEQIEALKNVGLHTVQMGVQSGSERTHKEIFHRPFSKDTVLKAAHILNNYHLECLYDFIIENDFEDDGDRDKTIELMLQLPRPYIANLFVMTVFPKTDLERLYSERNMTPRIDPYTSNYFEFNDNDFYYQLASLIPLVEEREGRRLFESRANDRTRLLVKRLYSEMVHRL